MANILVRVFVFGVLTILPGSWLAFGLPLDELSLKTRLALGVALSPAVLGIQFLIIRFSGVNFATAALILVAVNLAGIILLIRHLKPFNLPRFSRRLVFSVIVFLLLVGYLLLPWSEIPNYRRFSWHALMHTDIVYDLIRTQGFPEEPEIAGLTLSFSWMPHPYWSIIGEVSDWSPTSIYPISNLVYLLVAFVLGYELALKGFNLHPSTAILSNGLIFLGTNTVGAIAWIITKNYHYNGFIFGDVRYTPLLSKYLGFETMPFAFALIIGLTLVCLVSMRRKNKYLIGFSLILLIGLGLTYPILFPMGCLLVGGLMFMLIFPWVKGLPKYSPGEKILFILMFSAGITIVLIFLDFLTQDRAQPLFQLAQSGRKSKLLQIITSQLPLVLISAPMIIKSIRRHYWPVLYLSTIGFLLMGLYALIDLSSLEYKYILGSTIAMAPLASASVDPLFSKLTRGQWGLVLAIPLLLVGLNLLLILRTGAQIPENLKSAPNIIEDHFWIELAPSEQSSAWIRAIRESTPDDTILIAGGTSNHIGPFVARSLYFPSDVDGESATGYSIPNQFNLLVQRGYPEHTYGQRQEVVTAIYGETDPIKISAVIHTLRSINRPIAICFQNSNSQVISWLRDENIGYELFSDSNAMVWFIEKSEN